MLVRWWSLSVLKSVANQPINTRKKWTWNKGSYEYICTYKWRIYLINLISSYCHLMSNWQDKSAVTPTTYHTLYSHLPVSCMRGCASVWDSNQTAATFSTLINTRIFFTLTVRILLHAHVTGRFCENSTVKRELQWLVKAPETVNFLLNKKMYFYFFFLQNMIEKGKLQSLDSCESFSTEAVTSILLLESSPKAKIFSNFIFFLN